MARDRLDTMTVRLRVTDRSATLALLTLGIVSSLLYYASTLEDALITLRYARRWSEGYAFGMWNRVGEPVEGFSSFLWMVWLSAFGPGADAMAHSAKIVGMASYLGLIGLLLVLARRIPTQPDSRLTGDTETAAAAFRASAWFVGSCFPLAWYATSGMESVPFAFLATCSALLPLVSRNVLSGAVVSVALALIRPEGILLVAVCGIFWFLETRDRRVIVASMAGILAFAVLVAFRLGYFGYLLPNSYYAKAGNPRVGDQLAYGIRYFVNAAFYYWPLLVAFLLAALGQIISRRPAARLVPYLFGLCAMFYASFAVAGADNQYAFPFYRHFLSFAPLLSVAVFLWLAQSGIKRTRFVMIAVVVLTGVTTLFTAHAGKSLSAAASHFPRGLRDGTSFSHHWTDFGLIGWLDRITGEETVIATSLAGQIPFLVDGVHVDVLGLNDEKIAHEGTFDRLGPVDSKTRMDLVLDREPDLIEGFMPASILLSGDFVGALAAGRTKMHLELILDPRFMRDYVMIADAPYDNFDRIIFAKRNWIDAFAPDLATLPVEGLVAAAAASSRIADVQRALEVAN